MTAHAPVAPPTSPGSLPTPGRTVLDNKHGLFGFILCCIAVFATPFEVLLRAPVPFVPTLGVLGVVLCLSGCFHRPRRLAVIGLLLVLLSVIVWQVYSSITERSLARRAAVYRLSANQFEEATRACFMLTCAVEQVRASKSALPPTFDTSVYKDPWGRAYRYTLAPVTAKNPYGYMFTSDGPDGIAGNADDIDLMTMPSADDPLPMPSPPAPSPAPATGRTTAAPR